VPDNRHISFIPANPAMPDSALCGPTQTCQSSSGHPSVAGECVEYTVPSSGGNGASARAFHAAPEINAAAMMAALLVIEVMLSILSVDCMLLVKRMLIILRNQIVEYPPDGGASAEIQAWFVDVFYRPSVVSGRPMTCA
jgi:hypothetical protein